MKNITEENLLKLGFKKCIVSPEESGCNEGYYYFTYDVGEDNRSFLISSSNDENEVFYDVEFFDFPELGKFIDINTLSIQIEIFKLLK